MTEAKPLEAFFRNKAACNGDARLVSPSLGDKDENQFRSQMASDFVFRRNSLTTIIFYNLHIHVVRAIYANFLYPPPTS